MRSAYDAISTAAEEAPGLLSQPPLAQVCRDDGAGTGSGMKVLAAPWPCDQASKGGHQVGPWMWFMPQPAPSHADYTASAVPQAGHAA